MTAARATALVGIGSNLGDRLGALRDAVARLRGGALADTTVTACSTIVESRAMGGVGPNFLNAALALDTSLTAAAVLAGLHGIEDAMGRVRRERWEPRVIDLDLLAWVRAGDLHSARSKGALVLPHPGVTQRDFVLLPLVELWPHLEIDGSPVVWHLAVLSDDAQTVVGSLDARL